MFDLDGTLNQTEIYALKAYHHTLTDMKIDSYTDEQIMARFGATFEEDVQYFFKTPTQNIKNQYKNTLAKYWNQYIKEAKTYPFVKDVLSELMMNRAKDMVLVEIMLKKKKKKMLKKKNKKKKNCISF